MGGGRDGKNKGLLEGEKKAMQGREEDRMDGEGVRADHGRVWREESLQGLPVGGERTPSPGHPKQASCRHPLGTDSKSKKACLRLSAKCSETS